MVYAPCFFLIQTIYMIVDPDPQANKYTIPAGSESNRNMDARIQIQEEIALFYTMNKGILKLLAILTDINKLAKFSLRLGWFWIQFNRIFF